MRAKLEIDGVVHEVVPQRRADGVDIRFGERSVRASLRRLGGGEVIVMLDGRPSRVWVATQGDDIFVHAAGRAWRVKSVDDIDAAHGHAVADDTIVAPMPGTVVSVAAAQGAAVKRGETLIVIESMKLETAIQAPREGVVATLPLPPGATFDRGAVLATLEPERSE
jgi:acetyl/propionyl-CoA carboxylase alpha subunit